MKVKLELSLAANETGTKVVAALCPPETSAARRQMACAAHRIFIIGTKKRETNNGYGTIQLFFHCVSSQGPE